MNNAEQKVANFFSSMKIDVKEKVQKIYDDIRSKAIIQPVSGIAVTIINEEATQLNDCISKVKQRLKNAVIEAVVNFGISENYSQIIWNKVMQVVGVPVVQLCKSETIPINHGNSPKFNEENTKGQIESLKKKRAIYSGVAVAGVVAETVTLLVVPSFRGVAGVLKIAELIVVGVGVAGVVKTQKEISEIDRIFTEEKKNQVRRESIENGVAEICQKQCECNTNIINKWIDNVYSEFLNQCKSYL